MGGEKRGGFQFVAPGGGYWGEREGEGGEKKKGEGAQKENVRYSQISVPVAFASVCFRCPFLSLPLPSTLLQEGRWTSKVEWREGRWTPGRKASARRAQSPVVKSSISTRLGCWTRSFGQQSRHRSSSKAWRKTQSRVSRLTSRWSWRRFTHPCMPRLLRPVLRVGRRPLQRRTTTRGGVRAFVLGLFSTAGTV